MAVMHSRSRSRANISFLIYLIQAESWHASCLQILFKKQTRPFLKPMVMGLSLKEGYQKVSLELKTKIAKYALENRVQSAVNKFKNKVPNPPCNWHNTVRDWKEGYQYELLRKKKVGSLEDVVLQVKKRGRPLLVGKILDKQVQMYMKKLQKGHCIVNTAILISAAQGIVMAHDANLLSCNCGSVELKREWAKSLMMGMGLSKCKVTTQSSLSKFDYDEVQEVYLNDVLSRMVMEDIPIPLLINWDQTGTHFVPTSQWTMDFKGTC